MEVRDPVFSFEIARRAVGRAAFHLGIDTMSETALDVLADVLLNYLNRVGRTLSHLVEASGRTSAHVNFLDALQACEVVAAPAVERLHMRDSSGDEQLFPSGGANAAGTHLSSDWRGLAVFLFGPKWLEDDEEEPSTQEVQGAGGKQGPSALGATSKKSKKVGWDAPYLDEVTPFPQASEKCANPHPLPPHVGLSLHRAEEDDDLQKYSANEEELENIPDEVFTNSWGSLRKRKRTDNDKSSSEDATMTDAPTSPTKKQVKIVEEPSAAAAGGEGDVDKSMLEKEKLAANELKRKMLRIPSFYPPFPPTRLSSSKEQRTVVDTPPAPRLEQDDENTRAVRSSLVQLGHYWGSGWDVPPPKGTDSLSVPQGRGETGEQPTSSAIVVPLGRASGSRVSRILEGSMDAAAMQ